MGWMSCCVLGIAAFAGQAKSTFPVRSYPKSFTIVGYHEFGGPPEYAGGPKYDVHGLNIAPQTFRNQLDLMEKANWYPVNMSDMVSGHATIPAGKIPVVLTFDDGRPTQFKYQANGKIDPDCAVAILLDFHSHHSDWPLRGTFYLIAGSDANGVPFDQEGTEGKKVRQLLSWGFEIGNHTLTHPSFTKLQPNQVRREISGCQAYLQKLVPGMKVDTLALPYGDMPVKPKCKELLRSGGEGKGRYRNIAVLLFDGEPAPSPTSKEFNPYELSRVPPSPGVVEGLIKTLNGHTNP